PGHKVVVGYQSQDFAETMPPEQTLLEVVRNANSAVPERDIRGLLGSFGFSGDTVTKRSGVLSGGEKIRLAFARIFINPPNFLLLDEPTTNLDIQGREALEKAIKEYKGTVCFVSHDVAFVRGAADRIISVADTKVSSFPGNYDYYLEKTERIVKSETGSVKTETKKSTTPVSQQSSLSPQAARKQRAQEREAQKELRKMEAEMEKLQAQQMALNEKMASGDDDVDYADLGIQLAQIIKKLNAAEARWLEEADRLGA
ncbi:MAG: ATP-binding cassette domain-containing protein, partial [Kiritimatiellaceae bacterium]|nr:ATP-binding cassette domain-containing protein [Kiritimatiellaceae bacterium]